MRLVSWNCATGFRAKRDAVMALLPDLLIVPECSRKDVESEVGSGQATFGHWTGINSRKGLAVFAYGPVALSLSPIADDAIHYVVPLEIRTPVELNLLAVWTHPGPYRLHRSATCGYVGQIHRALTAYGGFLTSLPSVVIGDFNSSAIWDRTHPGHSHSDLAVRFDQLGMSSAYHLGSGEAQGAESKATHFFRRQRASPFHIDYCFASRELLVDAAVSIGAPDQWLSLSDHMPLVIDMRSPPSA
jgi:hypothetical protein